MSISIAEALRIAEPDSFYGMTEVQQREIVAERLAMDIMGILSTFIINPPIIEEVEKKNQALKTQLTQITKEGLTQDLSKALLQLNPHIKQEPEGAHGANLYDIAYRHPNESGIPAQQLIALQTIEPRSPSNPPHWHRDQNRFEVIYCLVGQLAVFLHKPGIAPEDDPDIVEAIDLSSNDYVLILPHVVHSIEHIGNRTARNLIYGFQLDSQRYPISHVSTPNLVK